MGTDSRKQRGTIVADKADMAEVERASSPGLGDHAGWTCGSPFPQMFGFVFHERSWCGFLAGSLMQTANLPPPVTHMTIE